MAPSCHGHPLPRLVDGGRVHGGAPSEDPHYADLRLEDLDVLAAELGIGLGLGLGATSWQQGSAS